MRIPFLALLLFIAPVLARADLVYKCKSVKFSDQLAASLRFNENGRGGRLELDYWNGYPPIGLVYADLKAPSRKGGSKVFATEMDSHSGYSATLKVPGNFLDLDSFELSLALQTKKDLTTYALSCSRF